MLKKVFASSLLRFAAFALKKRSEYNGLIMSENRPLSIFSVALRSFVKTFMGVIGIVIGLFLVLLLLTFDTKGDEEINKTAKLKVLPNLQGKRSTLDESSPVILELAISGVIGEKSLDRETIAELLQESKEGDLKDKRVKALLLTINSPGGGSVDSDGIYRAIMRYKEEMKIPVIAFIDGMAASGGFYIAAAADEIWTTQPSMIGSIGTLIPTQFNVAKPMETLGFESITYTAGKDKDILNPYRPWGKADKESLQPIVDAHYEDFVNIVVAARPHLSKEKLINDYGAQIFAAHKALELGYVDVVGKDKHAALRTLAEKAGLDPEKVYVVTLEKKNWVKELFNTESKTITDLFLESFGIIPPSSRLSRQTLWLWTP